MYQYLKEKVFKQRKKIAEFIICNGIICNQNGYY